MSGSTMSSGKIFVTGGSGHVGANVVHRLLADGHDLRCLVEPRTNNRALEDLPVERVEGDVRSAEDMERLIKGCTHVFHVAAKISTLSATPKERRDLFEINVIGTRNVMQAALRAGVQRAVLTGSFSSLGYDLDHPSSPTNEDAPFYPFVNVLPYSRSKTLAELEMYKCVAEGLDAVIATSCACVGPYDYLPSRIGRTMADFTQGRLRAYVDGGFPFVAARDIAEGHILAMEKGRKGHKYIFATQFHTLGDIIEMWTDLLEPPVKAPLRLPRFMALAAGYYAEIKSRLFPNSFQRYTAGAIEILELRRQADTSKAQKELGFQPSSIREAVREALEFGLRDGQIPSSVKLRE